MAHPIQHFSCIHTTQLLDCLHMKDWAKRKKVHAAICAKKAGSITNLGSRECQVEHREVIIYCISTHTMEDSSVSGSFTVSFLVFLQ